jgi:hypothetical protein
LSFDGRVAAVAIPQELTGILRDGGPESLKCPGIGGAAKDNARNVSRDRPAGGGQNGPKELHYRAFVNLLMVSLTTDYKKDQVHLPEILKRLR